MPKESDPDYPGTSSTATVDNDDDNQHNAIVTLLMGLPCCQASSVWQKEANIEVLQYHEVYDKCIVV